MTFDFKNKIVVVTGGNKGIGKGIVDLFVQNGARVYVLGRSVVENSELIEDKTINIINLKVDISNYEDIQTTFTKIINAEKRIDVLVNNAGITKDNLLLRLNESDWDNVIDINLKGAFNTIKAVVKQMISQRYGKIVNVGSIVGQTGNAGQINYSASKSGLIGLTKSVAKELASRNVYTNLVAPGFIQTDMTDKLNEEQIKSYSESIPLKRLGKVEDVANLVMFLSSDYSNYITGQVINVDGGLAM